MGCFSTTVKQPPPRDLGQEAIMIQQANTANAPEQYNLEAAYGPQYAALNRQIAQDNLFGGRDANAFIDQLEAAGNGHAAGLREGYNNAMGDGNTAAANAWLERAINNTQDTSLREAWDNAARGNDGILDMSLASVDEIAEQNRRANTAQREADIQDASNLGGQLQDLNRGFNSELYELLDKADTQATTSGGPGSAETALEQSLQPGRSAAARDVGARDVSLPGASSVLGAAQSQALADLELGGQIDPVTAKAIEQQVLGQYNAMGRSMDNRAMSAIATELAKTSDALKSSRLDRALGVEDASQRTEAQRIAVDQGNQDAALTAAQSNQAADLTRNAQNLQQTQQYRGGLFDLAKLQEGRDAKEFAELQQAVGNRLATQYDPTQGVLGRPSVNNTSFSQSRADGNFDSNPSGAMNVWNSYASQLNSQNFSEANANARQNAQTGADMLGGVIGMGGNIAAGMI